MSDKSTKFKLLGSRILLDKPQRPESKILLTPEAEAQFELEYMKKWIHLKVFAVGDEVTKCKKGDTVFIPAGYIQNADMVPFSENEKDTKMLVSENSIAIVW